MEIVIGYESSWRADGLNSQKNIWGAHKAPTDKTILGILSLLIGDVRRLNDVIKDKKSFYFSDLLEKISYEEVISVENLETVILQKGYMRTVDGDPKGFKLDSKAPQDSYIGCVDASFLNSDAGRILWQVLSKDVEEVLDFYFDMDSLSFPSLLASPLSLSDWVRFYNAIKNSKENLETTAFFEKRYKKEKEKAEVLRVEAIKILQQKPKNKAALKKREKAEEIIKQLHQNFNAGTTMREKLSALIRDVDDSFSKLKQNEEGRVPIATIYAAVIHKLAGRIHREGLDSDGLFNSEKGTVRGVSKNAFSGVRDALNNHSTISSKEKTVKTPASIKKVSGSISIFIDVEKDREDEIYNMIKNAHVAPFALGGKGLAYIKDIYFKDIYFDHD